MSGYKPGSAAAEFHRLAALADGEATLLMIEATRILVEFNPADATWATVGDMDRLLFAMREVRALAERIAQARRPIALPPLPDARPG